MMGVVVRRDVLEDNSHKDCCVPNRGVANEDDAFGQTNHVDDVGSLDPSFVGLNARLLLEQQQGLNLNQQSYFLN